MNSFFYDHSVNSGCHFQNDSGSNCQYYVFSFQSFLFYRRVFVNIYVNISVFRIRSKRFFYCIIICCLPVSLRCLAAATSFATFTVVLDFIVSRVFLSGSKRVVLSPLVIYFDRTFSCCRLQRSACHRNICSHI